MNNLHNNFLAAVKSLGLKFPASSIAKSTEYGTSIVSEYLNSKKEVSEAFAEKFCKVYGFDFEEMKGAGGKFNYSHPHKDNTSKRILLNAVNLFKKIPEPTSEDIDALNELKEANEEMDELERKLDELENKKRTNGRKEND